MDKQERIMLDNIVAYLQLGEELQAEFNIDFDVYSYEEDLKAVTGGFNVIASVERR